MGNQLAPIDRFRNQLLDSKSQTALASQLPSDIDVDRFSNVVIRAVQENPDLLMADTKTLFTSCERAAKDGLMPDGREGALVIYNRKVGNGQWKKFVQWQPMISGLRKRLANHGFSIRAECVHENDLFQQDLGDEAAITHQPPPLGEERGEIVGAYAIATGPDGSKYREVMDLKALEKVRATSKSNSGPWQSWTDQMYRKTVAKRLVNWLPLPDDERLVGLIARDNEQYDLEPQAADAAKEVQAEVRKPVKKKAKKKASRLPKVTAGPAPSDQGEEDPSPKEAEPAKPKKTTPKKKATAKRPKPPPKEPIEGEVLPPDEEPVF